MIGNARDDVISVIFLGDRIWCRLYLCMTFDDVFSDALSNI